MIKATMMYYQRIFIQQYTVLVCLIYLIWCPQLYVQIRSISLAAMFVYGVVLRRAFFNDFLELHKKRNHAISAVENGNGTFGVNAAGGFSEMTV